MLTINELFAGIGSQRAALERLGIEHKIVGIAEIDRFATLSYAAIYNNLINEANDYDFPSGEEMIDYLKERNIGFDFKKNKPFSWERMVNKKTGKVNKTLKQHYLASVLSNNYGDISKIDKLDYADFWTYSFPCQDISVAGKQAGIEHGKTRSGLLYEVERLLEKSKECEELPKYLMLENVKNLVGKKFKPQFEEWIERLDELGYNTYWQVLNAKNYGIPQNRERVFAISIRKDIDTGYVFPEPFELKIRLKDVLEDEVDEKFYINNARMNVLLKNLEVSKLQEDLANVNQIGNCVESEGNFENPQRGRVYSTNGCSPALNCVGGGGLEPKILELAGTDKIFEPSINQVGMLDMKGNEQIRRVYGTNGISPTLNTMQGGHRQPKILETYAIIKEFDVPEPVIVASRGRNPNNPSDRTVGSPTEQRLEINRNGISNTITTVQKDNYVLEPKKKFGRMGRQAVETYNEKKPKYGSTINPFNKTVDNSGNSPTLTTRPEGFKTAILTVTFDFRIRKLTPLECWRLMGFIDGQFYRAVYGHDIPVEYVEKLHNRTLTKKEYRVYHRLTRKQEVSNSQLYKQAGNSIVVDVLYYIFRNLFTTYLQTVQQKKPSQRVNC